ncbi:MAG: AraC family transcriptional regulator [Kofleriaceae bacterium]|nr:AraC family transcriptional regulator [Kofleriaceae bacterium]
MHALTDSFSGALLLAVLQTFEKFSIPAESLLSEVDLSVAALQVPGIRVPQAVVDTLWHLAKSKSGMEDFGLQAAKILEPKHLGVFGYVVLSSANVREAIERMVRFKALTGDASSVQVHVSEQGVRYVHTTAMPPLSGNRQHAEWSMAGVVLLLRAASGQACWSPSQVTFKHRAPSDLSSHRDVFGCELRFDCPEDTLLLELSFLEMPFLDTDSSLSNILETHATHLLHALPEQRDFVRGLQMRLQKQLPGGNPSVEALSDDMGISVRSLQRRLEEQGQTFQTVLDDIRVRLADVYLEESSTTIAEVAFLLGYSGASAFARAFKRWRLVSPTEWRSARG